VFPNHLRSASALVFLFLLFFTISTASLSELQYIISGNSVSFEPQDTNRMRRWKRKEAGSVERG
jgi:hypothetical protein